VRDLASGVFSQTNIVLRVFGEAEAYRMRDIFGHSTDLIDLSSLLTFQFREDYQSVQPAILAHLSGEFAVFAS
jgi:hypothetical protein